MPGGPGQTETLAKCLGTELNRRRRPFQGRALPTELPRLENLIKLTEERRTRKDRIWKCCGTPNQSCETNAGVPRDGSELPTAHGSVLVRPAFTKACPDRFST